MRNHRHSLQRDSRLLIFLCREIAPNIDAAISTTLDESDERYSSIQTGLHGAQELMTDRNGYFRIEGLDARATYDLYIDHRSGLQDVRHGIRPQTFIEIGLPMTAGITGRTLDPSGKPIDGFDVLVENLDNGTSRSQSFTDRDGQFKMVNLFPGRLHVAVSDKSGELTHDSDADLKPGQTLDVGRLTLKKFVQGE